MGERTLRCLLIIGASAVLRWAAHHGAPAGSWIARMLACKPPMLVRVALANKMARIVWVLVDIVVQCKRMDGGFRVTEVYFDPHAKHRYAPVSSVP